MNYAWVLADEILPSCLSYRFRKVTLKEMYVCFGRSYRFRKVTLKELIRVFLCYLTVTLPAFAAQLTKYQRTILYYNTKAIITSPRLWQRSSFPGLYLLSRRKRNDFFFHSAVSYITLLSLAPQPLQRPASAASTFGTRTVMPYTAWLRSLR